VLTASGGALRDLPVDRLSTARVEDVLAHPTWNMGAKVTVDSATLTNKAMEVIEAHWLFGIPLDRIEIVVHRESFVHSLVRLTDGSLLAHLGEPDMRVPIQFALCYPDAAPLSFGQWRPDSLTSLSFEAVDARRYPCLEIMLRAAREGGTGPAVAAAADEVAVEAFVAGAIRFTDIAAIISEALSTVAFGPCDTLEAVLDADARSRETARACVALAVARSA